SSSEITLSWTASIDDVGVIGYRIYRDGGQIGTTASTSYQDTGLTGQRTYTYTVAAIDAAGHVSPRSAPVSATTTYPDVAAPTVPNLWSSGVTSTSITITWDASTDDVAVAGYYLFRDDAMLTSTTSTAFTDVGLSPSTTYSYSVAAFDASGNVSA